MPRDNRAGYHGEIVVVDLYIFRYPSTHPSSQEDTKSNKMAPTGRDKLLPHTPRPELPARPGTTGGPSKSDPTIKRWDHFPDTNDIELEGRQEKVQEKSHV